MTFFVGSNDCMWRQVDEIKPVLQEVLKAKNQDVPVERLFLQKEVSHDIHEGFQLVACWNLQISDK
ncbi:hypothetical protein KI387_026846, partial [Taxus chinensis]